MKFVTPIVLVLVLTASLSACSAIDTSSRFVWRQMLGEAFGRNPANPNVRIRTVAVLPLLNQAAAATPPNMMEFADIFASELVQFEGFSKVIRPHQVIQVMAANGINGIKSPADVRRIGQLLKADAVFVGAITDYNPYYPPRIGFALQVYRTERTLNTGLNLEALEQAGKPIALSTQTQDYPMLGGEWIYDLSQNLTRNDFDLYTLGRDGVDRALGREAHARIIRHYFRYVANRTIGHIIKQEVDRQEHAFKAMPIISTPGRDR